MDNREKYLRARELVKAGAEPKEAIEKTGLNSSTYYYWKSAIRKETRAVKQVKHKVVALPVEAPTATDSGRLIMFVGTPDQIAQAARGLL